MEQGKPIRYAGLKGEIVRNYTFKKISFDSVEFENFSIRRLDKKEELYYNPIRALVPVDGTRITK